MGYSPKGIAESESPAVNTEVNITLGFDTLIDAVKLPFTADSNVADRDFIVEFSIGSDVVYATRTNVTIAADETKTLFLVHGVDSHGNGNFQYEPLPSGFILPAGATITTTTSNLQAGDQFGKVIVFGDSS